MKNVTANRVNMIRSSLNFLNNNTTATAGVTAFAGVRTATNNKLVLIDGYTMIANGNSIGVTLDTNLIRSAMCDIAFRVGNAVGAWASSTNNNTLRLEVTFTRPAFNRFKKDEVDDVCQLIHDRADTHIAAAGAFGYTATDVTDLQAAVDLFRVSVQNPRQAIITKKQAIANTENLVREIIDINFKQQIDKMVNTLSATNPDFVKTYYANREIIDIGSTHAKVRGTVKDEGDVPLIGVAFLIRKTGTIDIVKQTLTVFKGKFTINEIPADDYDFFWVFSGYKTVRENNVHISAGKELQRKIVLKQVNGSTSQHVDIANSQILVLDSGLQPTDAGSAYFKNTSPAGVSLNIYFAANPGDPFTGTGITLSSGQEVVVDSADIGPIQPYLLVHNTNPFNGGLDFTKLS